MSREPNTSADLAPAAPGIWERYVMALDEVTDRMQRISRALKEANVGYALVGGQAVALWVATKDPAAVRTTKDVNILLRREDLPQARAAAATAALDYFEVVGVGMFLERSDPNPRKAVHLIWSGEKVRPEYPLPSPTVEEREIIGPDMPVVSLAGLVRMKIMSNRDQDRVHLRDLIDVGLVDRGFLAPLPPELASRLDALLSEIGGRGPHGIEIGAGASFAPMKPGDADLPAASKVPLCRRRFQFRLRSLFLLMLLLGAGMMWFVPIKKNADRQRAVVELIRRDGGWVFYDDDQFDPSGTLIPRASRPGAWLRGLLGDDLFATVTNAHATNAAVLGHLSDLTELLHLDLQKTSIFDRDLEQLSSLHQLRILCLDKTAITDEGIKRLTCLTDLKHLGLGNTKITDVGLEQLKCLKQLKLLGLDSTNITDAGLRRLADMKQLECLVLNNTRITDVGLAHLTGLKELNQLCLDGTSVTAAGLLTLHGLPKLKTVFAHKTGIGANQLGELKRLSNLEWLCLTGVYFNDQDFTELQRALPKCYIQFDGF